MPHDLLDQTAAASASLPGGLTVTLELWAEINTFPLRCLPGHFITATEKERKAVSQVPGVWRVLMDGLFRQGLFRQGLFCQGPWASDKGTDRTQTEVILTRFYIFMFWMSKHWLCGLICFTMYKLKDMPVIVLLPSVYMLTWSLFLVYIKESVAVKTLYANCVCVCSLSVYLHVYVCVVCVYVFMFLCVQFVCVVCVGVCMRIFVVCVFACVFVCVRV